MDNVARVAATILSTSRFELEALVLGRHNNIYLLEEPCGEKYFVKEYLSKEGGRFYEDALRRYRREKLILQTANSVRLPVPELLAADDEHLILIEEYCNGETLENYLQTGGNEASLASVAGIWIGYLHSLFPIENKHTPLCQYATIFDDLQESVLDDSSQRTLNRISSQLEEQVTNEWALCRNDCHPGNFIVREDELIGLDFEMASFQPANMDVAGMAIAIGRAKGWLNPAADRLPQRLEDVLMKIDEGYNIGRGTECDRNHAAYVAIRFLKIAKRSEERTPWISAAGRVLNMGP